MLNNISALSAFALFLALFVSISAGQFIQYPNNGFATMTHYTMPSDYVASCGCTGSSSQYPTAAMSQMAFGSSTAYGPSCGRCFTLTLLNTFLSDPPFYPSETKSVTIKVTDLCPLSEDGWCDATLTKLNPGGHDINFDLVYPSAAIPVDFFPSNETLYGYTDFGVWNISYESVTCADWSGWKDGSALGSVAVLGDSGCCPADPSLDGSSNTTCPSYSASNDIPPDTITSASTGHRLVPAIMLSLFSFVLSYHYF